MWFIKYLLMSNVNVTLKLQKYFMRLKLIGMALGLMIISTSPLSATSRSIVGPSKISILVASELALKKNSDCLLSKRFSPRMINDT
jgi:hypothetical protein